MDFTKAKNLINYCLKDDYEAAFQLLDPGGDPKLATDELGVTVLHIASRQGKLDVVKELITRYGFDPNCCDANGTTPFHEACFSGSLETVRYLVEETKCDTRATNNLRESGLHIACKEGQEGTVKLLVTGNYCDPTWADSSLNTAFHTAGYSGNSGIVKFLLESTTFHPATPNSSGDTLVHIACNWGWLDVLKMIDIDSDFIKYWELTNSEGITPLHLACNRNLKVLSYLVENHWEDTLHMVCKAGKAETLAHLLSQESVCSMSRRNTQPILFLSMKYGYYKVAQCLIERGFCKPNLTDENENTALHTACRYGWLELAKVLVSKYGSNPQQPNKDGETPVHIACKEGHLEIVEFLTIGNHIKWDSPHEGGSTLLRSACLGTDTFRVVKFLFKNFHFNLNFSNTDGNTPLHVACHSGNLEALMFLVFGRYCNLNKQNKDGDTPLHIACGGHRLEVVEFLVCGRVQSTLNNCFSHLSAITPLTEYCNPDITNKNGQTALDVAWFKGELQVAKLLVQYQEMFPTEISDDGSTVLHKACELGWLSSVKYLLTMKQYRPDQTNALLQTPLHIAGYEGNVKAIHLLLKEGYCNPHLEDINGNTILHTACNLNLPSLAKVLVVKYNCNPTKPNRWGISPFHIACSGGILISECEETTLPAACCTRNLQVVEFLIPHCNPKRLDQDGNTALHIACNSGSSEAVMFIVSGRYCDLDAQNRDGDTPLHVACRKGHYDIVEFLLTGRISSTFLNTKGGTDVPLSFVKGVQTVDFVVCEEHCNPDIENYGGLTALRIAWLEEHIDIVQLLIIYQYMPKKLILAACENGWTDIVKYAVDCKNCNLEETNTTDDNVLHSACRGGHLKIVKTLLTKSSKLLEMYNAIGQTPLHTALFHDNIETLKVLVCSEHCNSDIPDSQGNTILHKACEKGDLDMVHFLISGHHCSPDKTNKKGNTSLHLTFYCGELEIVQYLLACGSCNPNLPNRDGDTPLHLACRTGDFGLVKCLVTGKMETSTILQIDHHTLGLCMITQTQYNLNIDDCSPLIFYDAWNILYNATIDPDDYHKNWPFALTQFLDIIRFLACYGRCMPRSLLHFACENRWTDIVQYALTSKNCNLDETNSVGENALHVACRAGHPKITMSLLAKTPELLDKYDEMGQTPLHIALFHDNIETVKVLVCSEHCNPDIPDSKGNTILHKACEKGDLDLVHFLISGHHCSPACKGTVKFLVTMRKYRPDQTNFLQQTPLHIAACKGNLKLIGLLLKQGYSNPHQEDFNGNTILHTACNLNLLNLVRTLVLEYNCNPTEPNRWGVTPIYIACREGHLEIVRFLINRECTNQFLSETTTPLHSACCGVGNLNVIELLILHYNPDQPDANGSTALHIACNSGNLEVVVFLVSGRYSDLNKQNRNGDTPLHVACRRGHYNAVEFLLTGKVPLSLDQVERHFDARIYVQKVDFVVCEEHCNPDIENYEGLTALHIAWLQGHTKVVRLLTMFQMHVPTWPDLKGNTILSKVISEGWLDAVEAIVSNKHWKPYICNEKGSLLHVACKTGNLEVVKWLLTSPNSPYHDLAVDSGQTEPVMNLNASQFVDKYGDTPLNIAFNHEHFNIVKYLVGRHHCNPDLPDQQGDTLLHKACRNGNLDLVHFLISGRYCSLHAYNHNGDTCLHTACMNCNLQIVQYLLACGSCNPDSPNHNGDTPLHLACRRGDFDLVKHLVTGKVETPIILQIDRHTLGLCAVNQNQCNPEQFDNDGRSPLNVVLKQMSEEGVPDSPLKDIVKLLSCYVECIPRDLLFAACEHGWLNVVQYAVTSKNCNLDGTNSIGENVLHIACRAGYTKIVMILLTKSPELLDKYDTRGQAPLHTALFHDNIETLKALVYSEHCNPDISDSQGNTILHKACEKGDLDLVHFLISGHHCSPESLNIEGNTCLHVARYSGNLEAVVFLAFGRYCNLNKQNKDGDTPLHTACQRGSLEMAEFLVCGRIPTKLSNSLYFSPSIAEPDMTIRHTASSEYCNSSIVNKKGLTALDTAWLNGDLPLVKLLVPYQGNFPTEVDDNKILHKACELGWLSTVNFLVTMRKYRPDQTNFLQQTPLHIAACKGNLKLISLLLKQGYSNPHQEDFNGNTILHTACNLNLLNLVRTLVLEYNCNPTKPNRWGVTPIYIACRGGHLEIVRFLINRDCTNQFQSETTTPLHSACCGIGNLNVIELLILHYNPDQPDANGSTALHVACNSGNLEVVVFLVSGRYSDLNKQNRNGDTTLHVACRRGHYNAVEFLLTGKVPLSLYQAEQHFDARIFVRKVDFVVCEEHCNPDIENYEGLTALHIAWLQGHTKIVRLLIMFQMHVPTWPDLEGNTILSKVISEGWLDALEAIVSNKTVALDGTNSVGENVLHIACRNGYTKIAMSLLAKDPKLLDKFDKMGQTPLHTALSHNIKILKLLVCSEHCNPDIPDSQGNTILHKACEKGDLDMVHFLISGHHCSPDKTNNDGDTCLHLACNGNLEIVQYLVGGGFCHPNIPNKKGNTPLHIACMKNNFDVVKYLVTREVSTYHHLNFQTLRLCAVTFSLCNPEHVNSAGHTALSYAWMMNKPILRFLVPYSVGNDQSLHRFPFLVHTAVKEGWPTELLKYLHTANRTTMKDSKGNTPIHIACNANNWKAVKTLLTCHPTYLEERNDSGDLPLHLTCKSGSLDLIKILLSGKYCNLDFLNEAGQTPLHIAFKQHHNGILEFLITGWHCNPHSPDSDGNTILHLACRIGDVYTAGLFVHNHFCDLSHSTSASNNHGDTPLHLASQSNHFEIVEMLLPYNYHYLERQNSVGDTPLHDACRSGDLKLTKVLVSAKYCNLDFLNNEGEGPLHIAYKAGHTDIAMFLITGWHCNPNFADSDGNTILHLACGKGDLHTVEFLISNLFCDPTLPNKHGNTLLHIACFRSDLNLLQSLLHYCNPNEQNCAGNTPLHIACRKGDINAVLVLTSCKDVSLEKLNNEGNTPLHIACSRNSKVVTLLLLNKVKGSVSWKNAMGKTPMQLTTDDEIIRELIGYGAHPHELYDRFQDVLLQSKTNHPLKSFVKVFICGDHSTGKSTLAKALQSESKNPVLALTSRVTGTKVKDVDCYTAGISLSRFKGKKFGHVLLYDFAGHSEYYGSHEAILESTVSSSAPVFFILMNLEEEEGVIARQLQYWLSFLGVHCVGTLTNPHVIVVGSHLDILKDNSENPSIKKSSIVKTAQAEAFEAGLKFVGYVQLDCRKFESTRMATIRDLLSKSCETLRAKVEINSQCHVLFAVLVEEFSGVAALALFNLISRIESASSNLPLPYVPDKLLDLLSILNDRGHILLLRNAESPLQSWIILDQTVLLQEVNATVFAPENFRQHHDLAHSSTGVVPFTKIQGVFSNHDPDMIIQFLVNLEFCRKISDETVLSLICPAMAGQPDLYYFFPALVNAERPDPVWKPDSQLTSASGWCLQCTKQGQFFTPRFLQVLLLRLTFSFAAIHDAADQESDPPVLRRKCCIWKNGLLWADTNGNSALVEITKQNTAVLVLVRCSKKSVLDCAKLRSGIIRHVLRAKEDICSCIKTAEFIIDPSQIQQYPFSSDAQELTVFKISDIAVSIMNGRHFVLDDRSSTISTQLYALLHFEPYSTTVHGETQEEQWRKVLNELFDETNSDNTVPDNHLNDFANFMAEEEKIILFRQMLCVRKSELEAIQENFKGPVCQLYRILYHWKEALAASGTYSALHSTLDQYSIFCGRNPLDVAHGETRLKREPLQSQ